MGVPRAILPPWQPVALSPAAGGLWRVVDCPTLPFEEEHMPHDAKGNPIKVGDRVLIECTVERVDAGEEYCNVSLKTIHPMYPGEYKSDVCLNATQVEVIRPEKGISA